MDEQNQINTENQEVPNTEIPTEEAPVEGTVFQEKESKVGPLIGSIIIILIIGVGGLYFLSTKVEEKKVELQEAPVVEEVPVNIDAAVEDIDEAFVDLEALDLEGLDAELNAIDAELDSI